MWFARLFGIRSDRNTGPRTQRQGPAAPAGPLAQGRARSSRPAAKPPLSVPGSAVASKDDAKDQGFDPYNSGSFERHNAWERVTRR